MNPDTGDIFVSDGIDDRIKRFDTNGGFKSQFVPAAPGAEGQPDDFDTNPLTAMWSAREAQGSPGQLALDEAGNVCTVRGTAWFADDPRPQSRWLVRGFTPDGALVRGFGHESFPDNGRLRGMAIDRKNQRIYVTNAHAGQVAKFDYDGKMVWVVGSLGSSEGQFKDPAGVAVDPKTGNVYVVDAGNDRIQVLDPDGKVLDKFGSKGSGPGQLSLNEFAGIAVDERGYVIVADALNHRVQVFDTKGRSQATHGSKGFGAFGQYTGLTGLAVAGGKLYVVDPSGCEVEVYDISGW